MRAVQAVAIGAAATDRTLAMKRLRETSSASLAAAAEDAPIAGRLTANGTASLNVVCARAAGMVSATASAASAAPSVAAAGPTPRRTRPCRSRPRPRARRLATVPTGHPMSRAASSQVRPSTSQFTIATR